MRKRGIMEGKRQLVEIEGGVLESDSEPKNDRKFIGVSFLIRYSVYCLRSSFSKPTVAVYIQYKIYHTTYKIESQLPLALLGKADRILSPNFQYENMKNFYSICHTEGLFHVSPMIK
jgi:hypothetical protein